MIIDAARPFTFSTAEIGLYLQDKLAISSVASMTVYSVY